MFQKPSPFSPEMPGVPAMMPSGGGEVSDAEAREFLLDQIVLHEWDMFQEINPTAGEEQFPSFKVTRSSQLAGWPTAVVLNYLQDVSYAVEAGRNLIMEKYAYMMEQTAPEYFNETLADQLPGLTMEAEQILNGARRQVGLPEVHAQEAVEPQLQPQEPEKRKGGLFRRKG